MSIAADPFELMRGVLGVFIDVLSFFRLMFRSSSALAAENLFLRKQLALYVERKKKPRRATDRIRVTLAHLSDFFDWRDALTVVKPDTLIRWHRKGFRLLWKWKSRPSGRPRVPADVQKLDIEMAMSNRTWGEERIANELLLKIGIQISPRTVRQYMPQNPKRPTVPAQRWMTFVRNHAKAIIAADFFVVVTATFRLVYGDRNATDLAFERDAASDSGMDTATVSRMYRRRRGIQVHYSRSRQYLFEGTGFVTSNIRSESSKNTLPGSTSDRIL